MNIKEKKFDEYNQSNTQPTFSYKIDTAIRTVIIAIIGAKCAAKLADKLRALAGYIDNSADKLAVYIYGFVHCAISSILFYGILSMIGITYKLLSKGTKSMAESGQNPISKDTLIIDSAQAMTFYKD